MRIRADRRLCPTLAMIGCAALGHVSAAAALSQPSTFLLQSSPSVPQVQPIAIRLPGPARVGFPIWLYADLRGPLVARYPFGEDPRYFGSNRLELRRGGQSLPALRPKSGGSGVMGIVAGSIAPPTSPQNRLPLHLAFAIDRPGSYSVRWTVIGTDFSFTAQPAIRERVLAQSDWLDFIVIAAIPADHEAWLAKTLAAPPPDTGLYIGDYLPSLMAAASDRRVAQAVLNSLYSGQKLIGSCALSAFGQFPASTSVPLLLESLRQRGPVVDLAYFVSWHAPWFQDRRDEIVRNAISFLESKNDAASAGALQMLIFARHFDWKGDITALRNADNAVERSAPALAARAGPVAQTLAAYSPTAGSTATRNRLWQQVERRGTERQQALIALTWLADMADLSRIGDLLVQPGNPDPRGTDLSSLPSALVRAYGDPAIPYLQKALAESPYVWVRTQSAEQLALKGKVEAFRFFLDAISSNRSYRDELVNWLKMTFRLPRDSDDSEVTAFLNEQIRDPKGPPTLESPIQSAILQLQSREVAMRQTAAQNLLDLAKQSAQNDSNIAAYLIDGVIRKPAQMSPDTWRDAALILGRLSTAAPGVLTLSLDRDGATAGLIEMGEPAVGAVADVLYVGGTLRRRLAAGVLGAIGSATARDALTLALRTESDASVKQAIQSALAGLGKRPAPAEIR